MNLKETAKTMNVDEMALTSLVTFLSSNIMKHDQLRAAFLLNPDLIIEIGTRKWFEASVKYSPSFRTRTAWNLRVWRMKCGKN